MAEMTKDWRNDWLHARSSDAVFKAKYKKTLHPYYLQVAEQRLQRFRKVPSSPPPSPRCIPSLPLPLLHSSPSFLSHSRSTYPLPRRSSLHPHPGPLLRLPLLLVLHLNPIQYMHADEIGMADVMLFSIMRDDKFDGYHVDAKEFPLLTKLYERVCLPSPLLEFTFSRFRFVGRCPPQGEGLV